MNKTVNIIYGSTWFDGRSLMPKQRRTRYSMDRAKIKRFISSAVTHRGTLTPIFPAPTFRQRRP